METAQGGIEPPPVPSALIRPYASVVVLLCVEVDPEIGFEQLLNFLRKARQPGRNRTAASIIAYGMDDSFYSDPSLDNVGSLGFDQLHVTVHRVERKPGWLKEPAFVDIDHELTIALQKSDLVAVHAPGPLRDSMQRWLDRAPRPHLRRIPSSVLEDALLRGETRSLWLRGTHPRRTTKADSKAIAGPNVKHVLSPFDDSTFSMGSARSRLADNPDRSALKGVVGATPDSSLVWNRQTDDIKEFIRCIKELFGVLAEALDKPSDGDVFPLARQVHDLQGVYGAYEISCTDPSEMPMEALDNSDKIAAAQLLQDAVLDVEGRDDSADFDLHVGLDGKRSGRLGVRVRFEEGHVQLSLGYKGEPTDHLGAAAVREALEFTDLLTIYYASGHAINGRSVFVSRIRPMPFPNWRFEDFDGYDITREKPLGVGASPLQIHDAIGSSGDTSLFAWVASHYCDGWLTCDDGSGEVADFVHLAHNGTLSLIHVKAANSWSPSRRVSTTAYEVVTSQATKNVSFLDSDLLIEHLKSSTVSEPACWFDGNRISSRLEIVEGILLRDVRDEQRIVIVQPHLSKKTRDALYEGVRRSAPPSPNLSRLRRVEDLLNSSRQSITGLNADLLVIGSLR